MQPSMFNVRVPLDGVAGRDDVFLMNTFTDAQLIVSRDVVGLLDRIPVKPGRLTTPEREALATLAEHGFIVPEPRHRAPAGGAVLPRRPREHRAAARHGADDAAVQLRLRLLPPGRSRRVQQERGQDVDRDRGAGRRVVGAAPRRGQAGELRADLLRRRAAAQPAGDLPPGRAAVGRLPGARRPHDDQHHHQRPAPDPRDRRPAEAVRPQRREDHARRRPRDARPDAAAARRAGHLRQDHPQLRSRSPASATSRSAAISTRPRSTATRRCSTSWPARTSPTSSPRVSSSRSSARRSPPSPRASSRSPSSAPAPSR